MVETISFKSTGVREIDLILFAVVNNLPNDKIQEIADKAAEVWKTLWADD